MIRSRKILWEMSLQQAINKICADMKKAENQADVEDYAVRPLLLALGWPDQLGIIRRQYRPDKDSKVDFALCHPETKKPLVFIEAKSSSTELEHKGEQQILKYAFAKGTPLVIWTNGKIWKFYYSQGDDDWRQRCFYDLNICVDDREKSTFTLDRYLNFHTVVGNVEAFKDVIQKDYKEARTEAHAHREIENTLPEAWQRIVNDTLLIELLRETVKEMCGYQPTEERIQVFLKALVPSHSTSPTQDTSLPSGFRGFVLNGKRREHSYTIDILIGVFNELTRINSSFPNLFAQNDFNRYKSRCKCLAKNKNDLLDSKKTRQLESGWYIDTTFSREATISAIRAACQIASVEYGKDLILYLPRKQTRERQRYSKI